MTQQKSNKLLIWSGAVILVAALAAFAAFDAHRRQGDVPQPSVKPDEPAVQPSEDQKNALKENALKGKPFTELYLASERLDHEGLSEDSTAIFRHILRADYSDAECLQDLTRRVNFKASSDLDDETKYAEIERLLDETLEARPNSWRVKTGVARLLDVLPNEGYMQDGKFVYTQPRLPAREDLLNCHERKRVRKLQLYADALPLVREELDQLGDAEEKTSDSSALFHENPSGYYLAFAGLFQNDVTLDFRRLLTLTDLSVLPDCQPVSEIRPVSIFDREDTRLNGAPVDEEGAPIFFTSPESFETAKNDGQRRQALLTELSERRPGYRATVCSQRARDAQALFGVQTLGWFAPGSSDAEQESRQKAIDDLKTLADNETIAKLENGVKRFELPPEYDYINLWREIAEIQGDSSSSALKEIALEYQNRRQLDKAADAWRRVLEQEDVPDHGLSQAKAALSQIVDSRVAIDSSSAVNGAKMDLNLRYRNAVGAEIVVKRLNVDEALKTVRNEEFWQEHGDILNMNSVVSTVLRRQYLPEENTENPELDALQKKLGELFNGAALSARKLRDTPSSSSPTRTTTTKSSASSSQSTSRARTSSKLPQPAERKTSPSYGCATSSSSPCRRRSALNLPGLCRSRTDANTSRATLEQASRSSTKRSNSSSLIVVATAILSRLPRRNMRNKLTKQGPYPLPTTNLTSTTRLRS
ncbi:MAG: hypothetical protein PHO46_11410 [Thermoguttaceae bacterium]|nr:hypothetical protein [Thermoguttaceae bacterium]